jgi:hypothetical protein
MAAFALAATSPAEAADLSQPSPPALTAAVVEPAAAPAAAPPVDVAAAAPPSTGAAEDSAAPTVAAVQAARDVAAETAARLTRDAADPEAPGAVARTIERASGAADSLRSTAEDAAALVSARVPSVASNPVSPAPAAQERARTTVRPTAPARTTRSERGRPRPTTARSSDRSVPRAAVSSGARPALAQQVKSSSRPVNRPERAQKRAPRPVPFGPAGSAGAAGAGWAPPVFAPATAVTAVRRHERGVVTPPPPLLPRAAKLVSLLERPG